MVQICQENRGVQLGKEMHLYERGRKEGLVSVKKNMRKGSER